MISNYEIVNGELNVTLDFNYEFGNINLIKNIDLKNEIIKLAKKFKTNKINIFVNGLLITSLLFAPSKISDEYNNVNYLTKDTIKNNFNVVEIKKDDIETNNNIKIENKNVSNNQIKSNKIENKTNNKINNGKEKQTESINENIEIKEEKEDVIKVVDNNTYVTLYRSNGTVLTIELEEYLIGVVASEMPASFNIEALKAQAIVSRTYALKRISEKKVLTDTVSTQVYKDNNELKNMWGSSFDTYYNKIKNAVDSTKGLVLTYNGNYIDAVFHSTSNGMTEDPIYVWGYSIPYLKSVSSEYDKDASSYKRDVTFTFDKLSNILNTDINENTSFELVRNNSNRVTLVKINDIEIEGTNFRSLLNLRSTDFNIETDNNLVKITTYGYGHGVGMSEYGANSMANAGYTYQSILNHYYTNVVIKKV